METRTAHTSRSDEESSEATSDELEEAEEHAVRGERQARKVLLALLYTFHVIVYTACLLRTQSGLQQSISMFPDETNRLECSSGIHGGVFYVAVYGVENIADKISFPKIATAHNWYYARENETRTQIPLNICVVGWDRKLTRVRECFEGPLATCVFREIEREHQLIESIIAS